MMRTGKSLGLAVAAAALLGAAAPMSVMELPRRSGKRMDPMKQTIKMWQGHRRVEVPAYHLVDKDEVIFLSVTLAAFLDQVKRTMPDVALPPVAGDVQKKLAMFRREMEK